MNDIWEVWVVGHRPHEAIYHVIPNSDWLEHARSAHCWCRPIQHQVGNLYVHQSADGRELGEAGCRDFAIVH